jgi:hypothetical protein
MNSCYVPFCFNVLLAHFQDTFKNPSFSPSQDIYNGTFGVKKNATFNVQQTNSVAFSSQVNNTDWWTATCWQNLVPTFADIGVLHGQLGGSPKIINLSFLDQSRYFSFK